MRSMNPARHNFASPSLRQRADKCGQACGPDWRIACGAAPVIGCRPAILAVSVVGCLTQPNFRLGVQVPPISCTPLLEKRNNGRRTLAVCASVAEKTSGVTAPRGRCPKLRRADFVPSRLDASFWTCRPERSVRRGSLRERQTVQRAALPLDRLNPLRSVLSVRRNAGRRALPTRPKPRAAAR